MRWVLRLTGALVAVLLLAGLAVVLLVPGALDASSYDSAHLRAAIEAEAGARLGTAIRIDGPVRLALFPRPTLEAHQVSLLHGSPGDADALAVTAAALRLRLDLRALLRGRLAAASVVLDGAELRLSWPLDPRILAAGRPDALRGTVIVLHHGRALVGAAEGLEVEATLAADAATGDTLLAGTFRLASGTAWRGHLRWSRPGGDGSAAVGAGLDEIYVADGPSASLEGQLAGDGRFGGRLVVSGPDLARVFPGPHIPFRAEGRANVAGHVATIADTALTLDGAPARLEAAWHLPPQPRIDVALAASRLDLDSWIGAWGAALPAGLSGITVPLGLHVTSDAAALGGGTLRDIGADIDLDADRLAMRDLHATLPGEMAVHASGTLGTGAMPDGRLDVSARGSDLRSTAAFLARLGTPLGLPAMPAIPRTLDGAASLEWNGPEWEVHGLVARLDDATLHGDALLTRRPGTRPNLAALLSVDRLDVAPWLAAASGRRWAGPVDAALNLAIAHANWRGRLPPDAQPALDLQATLRDGVLDLHHLEAVAPDWRAEGHGVLADGRWTDAGCSLSAHSVAALRGLLPPDWQSEADERPEVLGWPVSASWSGAAGPKLAGAATFDVGQLHVEATLSLASDGTGNVSLKLRHPDAAGLALALGQPAPWIGAGSLSASGDLGLAWPSIGFDGHVQAGEVAATAAVRLDRSGLAPALSGRMALSAVPALAVDWRSRVPLPTPWLLGWSADLDLATAGADLPPASLHAALAAGVLDLRDIAASLAGGQATGRLRLDAGASLASLDLAATGLSAPARVGLPIDLAGGTLDVTAHLQAAGHAPAVLLSTLSGSVRAELHGTRLTGLALSALTELSDDAVRQALGGETALGPVSLRAGFDHGLATLDGSAAAETGGQVLLSGSLDLAAPRVEMDIGVLPPIADPPRIAWHVAGWGADATVSPVLSDLIRWRAARAASGD